MQPPFMRSDPLGLPLCMRSVDYSLLPVGAMAGRTLPGGRTYTQAVGANQTEETVQTSESTVARWTFVANLPRIGLLADGGIGLVLEPPRTNLIPWSRDLASGTWQAGSLTTVTSNVGAGPDGASLADREQVSSTGFGRYRFDLVLTTSTAYYGSVWQRANSGTSSWQIDVNASGATNINQWYGGASVSTTWERRGVGNTTGAAGTVGGLLSADGRDGSAAGGIAAGARDLRVDLHQFEPGKYPTNAIITAGTTASRAGFRVSIPISHYVIGGSFRAQISHVPWADCTAYDGDSATVRLWTIDANTYAEINTTTRVLTVCVNGVSRVAAVPVWWLRGHRIEWYWRVGNGALFVRYRLSTDKGVSYTLPFDPFAGVQYTDAAISTSATSLDLWSDGGSSKWFGTGACKEDFLYTAPAWALQWLPTDDSSVKAWFRADGHYTLSGTAITAWTSQTATAVSAAQSTGAFQPSINSINGKPGFNFDGSNDSLAISGLTVGSGDLMVCAALDMVATLGVDLGSILIDSLAGRLIAAFRATATGGNLGYYDNVVWRAPAQAPVTGVQVLTYDLRTSPGGRIYRNGTLQGTAQTYSAIGIGGQTAIGSSYNNTGSWMRAILGDFVVASGQSDGLRTNLHAFNATKYGISVA